MKKQSILLLAIVALLAFSKVMASGYTIGNQWRWSKDSGSVDKRTEGTWLKPVNVAPVISMPAALRLRLLNVVKNGYNLSRQDTLVLEYREEPPSNSNVTISNAALKVNGTSPTAGNWKRVQVELPENSNKEFVIDPNYDDSPASALKDKQYMPSPLAHLLYNNEDISANYYTPGRVAARHEDVSGTLKRQGAIGLSKSNKLFDGAVSNFDGVKVGGLETEYRLVATKNAKPGTVYYFRLRNVRESGNGAGTIDAWDYAAGYPSIATSADYNGAVNTMLPDVSVSIETGFGSYSTNVSRSGVLRVNNASKSVATAGPIKVDISAPAGWNFNIASQPLVGLILTACSRPLPLFYHPGLVKLSSILS